MTRRLRLAWPLVQFALAAAAFFGVPLLVARWLWPVNPKYDLAIYVGTGLLVLWYTLETRGMRQEMLKTRQRLETPEVIVRLDSTRDPTTFSGFFDVIIENISEVPALDVTFTGFPDLPLTQRGWRTSGIGFLKHGIRYLAPRQALRSFFVNYPLLTQAQQHDEIEFLYSFTDTSGTRYDRRVTMNLSVYYNARGNTSRARQVGCVSSFIAPVQGGHKVMRVMAPVGRRRC